MCAHVINRNSHCYVSRSSGCCSPCREIQFWKWRVELWHLPLGDLQLRGLSIPWNDKPASARASGERWAKTWVGIHWLGWQGIRCYRCCEGTEGEQRCEMHPVCFWIPWVVWLLLCCNVRLASLQNESLLKDETASLGPVWLTISTESAQH